MATAAKLQDMPPPGGYSKRIPFARIPAKQYFSGYTMIAGYLGITAVAAYIYTLQCKKLKYEEIEARSARLAMYPMLLAERDREYLKQLNINREEEAKLMANVEGWKVGTWFGEPIYKTLPKDAFIDPTYHEYYVHAPYWSFARRAYLKLWS